MCPAGTTGKMTSNRKKRTHTAATTTKVSRRSPVLIVGRRFTRSPSSVRIATTISRKRTRYLLGNPGGSFSASWPYSTSFIGGSSAGENGAFARAAALFSSFPLPLASLRVFPAFAAPLAVAAQRSLSVFAAPLCLRVFARFFFFAGFTPLRRFSSIALAKTQRPQRSTRQSCSLTPLNGATRSRRPARLRECTRASPRRIFTSLTTDAFWRRGGVRPRCHSAWAACHNVRFSERRGCFLAAAHRNLLGLFVSLSITLQLGT